MADIIEMPKLSDTMKVGTLLKWIKQEGDTVETGDMVAEVETDKATMEMECFSDGIILKHYVKEGDQVPIGAAMAAVGEAGEEVPEVSAPAEEAPAPKTPAPVTPAPAPAPAPTPVATPAPNPVPAASVAPAGSSTERVKASPLAKKIAKDKNIPLHAVQGTGPGGRIVKKDVLNAVENGVTVSAAPQLREELVPVTSMRNVIASRLLESKTQVPHFYLEAEADAAPLGEARAAINAQFSSLPPEQGGFKLTVNDFILKASAQALTLVPEVNASWEGENIRKHGSVALSFGVALDDGLVTPVIRNAESKSLREVSADAKSLIKKARSKKLTPNEMSGSTFTVTNLGMFGVTGFYGIINMPNAAILSVGATIKKPVVDKHGNMVVGERMMVGLSCDHRVIDGAVAAKFLQELVKLLENPALIMV